MKRASKLVDDRWHEPRSAGDRLGKSPSGSRLSDSSRHEERIVRSRPPIASRSADRP